LKIVVEQDFVETKNLPAGRDGPPSLKLQRIYVDEVELKYNILYVYNNADIGSRIYDR